MKDEQLLRYSRQIMLPEMDVAGQQKLIDATVLIVGMGGLGCPAAMYLAAAGVGHLIIADDDVVELTNLQRQIAHSQSMIGEPKVVSAQQALMGLNPDLKISALQKRLEGAGLSEAVGRADLVVDACDNFTTRFAINAACIEKGKVAVFDSHNPDSPCYQCLYTQGEDDDMSCSENGVMAPLVGIIGAVQAMEALKLLAGIGESLTGRLLLLDASTLQWREMRLPRDSSCGACGG